MALSKANRLRSITIELGDDGKPARVKARFRSVVVDGGKVVATSNESARNCSPRKLEAIVARLVAEVERVPS